uniref:NIDO domain-containing protein n=1 Tax=Cynoglossus semilaevis TaxID=244447 RepID=A0A3P8VTS2_CYNSE
MVFELNKMATQTLLPLLVLLMIGKRKTILKNTDFPQSDDGSSPRISLSQPFQFFGRSHSSVYVNHNGDLTFTSAFSQYSPQNFPMRRMDIIAALWTDLDNRVTGSILYHEYTGGSILARATQDINTYFPGVQFTASSVFVATWYQMFGTTTAQAILITNGRFSFVMLNYGPIAQTTRPIQAGYDTQDSAHHYSLEGSMTTNSSDPNSRFRIRSNVGVPSRWVFRTDRTSRGCLVPPPAPALVSPSPVRLCARRAASVTTALFSMATIACGPHLVGATTMGAIGKVASSSGIVRNVKTCVPVMVGQG